MYIMDELCPVRDMGHEGRAGVKDGKDRDEDDQMDV